MDFTNYLTMRSSNMAAMKASHLVLSTLTGSTVMVTTHITAPIAIYSTLSGSTITISTLIGSTLYGSSMTMSSITTSFLTLSTLMVSSINNNAPGTGSVSFSTLSVSSLQTASTIITSSMNVVTGNITASSITSATGTLTVGSSLSIGSRLLGTTDTSPSGNFWMGLSGSGTDATRVAIGINGNATTGVVDSLKFVSGAGTKTVTLTNLGNSTYVAGDASHMKYGPNSTWSSYLSVGAANDLSGASTAQVIVTNGDLHVSGGNSNNIYYGYYATNRSAPNSHEFYGAVNLRNYNFYKEGSPATSNMTITGGTSANSPYLEFNYGGSRRCYIGNATASNFDIWAENGNQLTFGTAGSARMVINTAGDVTIPGRECIVTQCVGYGQFRAVYGSYGFFIRNDGDNTYFLLTAANDQYGIWNGLRPFYFNNAGRHVSMDSGLGLTNTPQQTTSSVFIQCLNNDGFTVSQGIGITREIYRSNSVAWTGGVNIVSAFFKYNAYVCVRISGMCTGYTGGATWVYPTFRLYSQSGGTYTYYETRSYTNHGSNHANYSIDYAISTGNIPNDGWYDLYFYSGGGLITDGNDRLQLNVTILPASEF